MSANECHSEEHHGPREFFELAMSPGSIAATRGCFGRKVLAGGGLAFALMMPAESVASSIDDLASTSPEFFKICQGQTYALCAVASCFVFNDVAYCKCDVKQGDSISLPFPFNTDEDVCTVNAEGADNHYMVSTFSPPESVVAPGGDQALYTCPAETSDGAYGQCDGGLCFTSSQGQSFSGFDAPLNQDQIICTCPITVADPATAKLGYQIAGPYPCQDSYFQTCKSAATNKSTGTTIPVGAPTGTASFLTLRLNGSIPPLNECPAPQRTD